MSLTTPSAIFLASRYARKHEMQRSFFRSNKGVQAQLIDDVAGRTLAAVNWTEKELKELGRMEQATRAGALLAERAKGAGVESVVFDRGGYRYHGRVKALADGAREAGLRF